MEYLLSTQALDKAAADCIMVGVYEKTTLTEPGQVLDRVSNGYLRAVLARGDLAGKLGSTLLLHDVPHLGYKRILLVGLGKQQEQNTTSFVKALKAGYNTIKQTQSATFVDAISGYDGVEHLDLSWHIKQAVLVSDACYYQFSSCKSKALDALSLNTITIAIPNAKDSDAHQVALTQAKAMAKGVAFMKNLANLPANICTPSYLAEQAKMLAKRHSHVKVSVMEVKEMQKKHMGALLSVARGSHEPAKMITIEYYGAHKSVQPIAIVGKGVTFDSGGISIKPAPAMDEMKYDMSGAASVLGTIEAIAGMQAPINVVGVIPATENLPGGNASKPGDIVTSMSGQTIEILNTDAEGRLILCDALTYVRQFNPKFVVDIATLTGAMVIALGSDLAGVFTADDSLAAAIANASRQSNDHSWRMPLWEPYQEQLDSPFADMANVGGRAGGSITAACFLARFTRELTWAHLDIAGVAYVGGSGKDKGSTGRPVPLLTQLLLNTLETSTHAKH